MDIDNIRDAIFRERCVSLRGLRSLYVYVIALDSRADFYEKLTVTRLLQFQGEETERLLKEAHAERMKAIKAAFSSVENKIREAGIDLIPVEEGLKNPECPRLVVTMQLGEPKKNASFSARMHF